MGNTDNVSDVIALFRELEEDGNVDNATRLLPLPCVPCRLPLLCFSEDGFLASECGGTENWRESQGPILSAAFLFLLGDFTMVNNGVIAAACCVA